MTSLDRIWAWRVRALCEVGLVSRGGTDLLDDARTEATWYVDLLHPWDGCGDEPVARVNAWLSIMVARLSLARAAVDSGMIGH